MGPGPALLQAPMPFPHDHFGGSSSSRHPSQYTNSMPASYAAPRPRLDHEHYGAPSTSSHRAQPPASRGSLPIERPQLPSFRELDLLTEQSRFGREAQAPAGPSLPSLSRAKSLKTLSHALPPPVERVDSHSSAAQQSKEDSSDYYARQDGDARGLPSPFFPSAFSGSSAAAEQPSVSHTRPDGAHHPRVTRDDRPPMSHSWSTQQSRFHDGDDGYIDDETRPRRRRRSDEGAFGGRTDGAEDHDGVTVPGRRARQDASEDGYSYRHRTGPQDAYHHHKVGGGSTPGSPRSRTERSDARLYVSRQDKGQAQQVSGTRFRALSTNDRPRDPLLNGGSMNGSYGASVPERWLTDDASDMREPMRRFSLGRKGEPRVSYYQSTSRGFEYYRDEGAHPRYMQGGDGRYTPDGAKEDVSYGLDPRRGGHTLRAHRFRPYSTGEARHAQGTPLTTHLSTDGFSSSRTSPTTSAASSPPLKSVYRDRHRGELFDGVGARGLVGLADSAATLPTVVEGHFDREGPMVLDHRGDYGSGSSPGATHSPLRMGETTPHNMKRTRNGYKYSCGIAGPACHMAGCPVKEITEEYEYLKSIPEKDRWRPLVIPLGNRNHPQHVAEYLKRWRLTHYDEPYLTKELSEHLRICLGLREEKQMSDWMTNARRRY